MAGLFSIFSESENGNTLSLSKGKESQIHVSSKLKNYENVSSTAPKNFIQSQCKPKGLSIRSKSDINVSCSNNLESNKFNSKESMKAQAKQSKPSKQVSVPVKTKITKYKSFDNIVGKKLSPKISSPIMQNVLDNFVFVKPEIPKSHKKSECLEPENLSYDFDHYKFMIDEMDSIINEERKLIKAARKLEISIASYEDEGFISGSDMDTFELQNEINLSKSALCNVELPEISDNED